ncbi:uncharacterized protein LOC107788686 isoform X3 [Nicotiana tabacum]|uniref:5'-3' exonuclease isoform X3 n=1 Tax=Nicotiana tabacum TaxID=4097 RepID=A0A1S3ZNC0_TOBAC|nr:5'-3' exonuclease isoform X2 [Nicotiana tomentosiformis]XP_016465876.1 PREDICTED: 5'-3' exonuclease-like isoform X3 [Nicotiana tabacum]
MLILFVTKEVPLLCFLLLIGFPFSSLKLASLILSLLLLTGKEVMSTEDNCYLPIKQKEGNMGISFQVQENLQGVRLKRHIDSSWMFFTTAMFLCSMQVVKIESHEADDVIATLVEQVLQRGHRVVVASPDKDFKQLISDDVQIVMPVPEFNRWSFYTLKHYVAQYNCDPRSDLSLRCILGDEVDGVPGIQHVVPGFGRKTALKLLKKHGTLENLLNAAAVRSVGKQYAQDALIKYADYLRRNYEVLSLKRDVRIHIEEQWLDERDARNDSLVLSNFITSLKESRNLNLQNSSHSNG